MEKIHKLIGHTEDQYKSLLFQMFFSWADVYSSGCPRSFQKLLLDRQINKWFQTELRKLIKQFREELKPFENQKNITWKDRSSLFISIVYKIQEIYPSALITEKKTTFNNPKSNFINN